MNKLDRLANELPAIGRKVALREAEAMNLRLALTLPQGRLVDNLDIRERPDGVIEAGSFVDPFYPEPMGREVLAEVDLAAHGLADSIAQGIADEITKRFGG